MSGETHTLTAGVDYTAPSASTSAFFRITNAHHTGAGDASGITEQIPREVTVYVINPSNITTSLTLERPGGVASSTRVSWEIVEYTGVPGGDNEMIVRTQSSVSYAESGFIATGTATGTVNTDADIVVFITGQLNRSSSTLQYSDAQSTAAWNGATNEPVFTRGTASASTSLSYAVVEFTGANWAIQRSEHTYGSQNLTETESITALGSLSRAFLHTQKRYVTSSSTVDAFGHEVWLSSVGAVSFRIGTLAPLESPGDHVSVAWVIENTQTGTDAMVVTRSNGTSSGGGEPLTLSVSIGKTLATTSIASLFVNTWASTTAGGTGFNHPGSPAGATIASTTHYEVWRSNTEDQLTYRTEVVEWPTATLSLTQNYYRFYVDNDALDPTDPWPLGATDLGENTVLTSTDEPLSEGERIRIRMSIRAGNATFPANLHAFKLQYGPMTTTCGAISESSWVTLGDTASTTLWRGHNGAGTTDGTLLSGDPPTAGDLNLSVSDVAGTLEETNLSATNTYPVEAGEDIEYDWLIEQNGAVGGTYYCFRMTEASSTPLTAYSNYPQIRTAPFLPKTQNWRWYDDEVNVTPVIPLDAENVAPVDIADDQVVKLRMTVKETENVSQDDTRFKLQYSEYADFSTVFDVVATSTCTATSTWCYANGAGTDNAVIPSVTLSDADSCIASAGDGCGTHNESPEARTGFRHENSAAAEYEFTLQSAGPRVNRVYYFRLYDLSQSAPISVNTGESYPSLVTEGASLSFTMEGLSATTVVEGVTLDINTSPTTIPFGTLPQNTLVEGGHRLLIDANGTEGYKILMTMTGDFTTAGGATIEQVTGTNGTPLAWGTGCDSGATSCFGYHTGDDTLENGSARFAALDTYAQFSTTTAEEISYSSQPVLGDTTDIVFRILVRNLQDAGIYETNIMYISVPIF